MKKIALGLGILSLSAIFLAGCGSGDKKTTASKASEKDVAAKVTKEKMTVGVLPAESAIPIILAKEEGFFKAEGLDVDVTAFSAPTDRNVAVQAKQVDATISDVMTEATFKQNGIDMTITSGILEDFKVIASPQSGITEMKALAGKKVTLVKNFILEYIMDKFAEKEGFKYNVVEIPSFSARTEAIMNGSVDGAVYTEPQTSQLASQGAKVLGSSKDEGWNGGAIQFMSSVIKERPQDVAAFYKAYNKAIDYMNDTPAAKYADLLSKYQLPDGMSTYLDAQTEDFPYAGKIDKAVFTDIIKWANDKKQISTEYTYDELVNNQFIEKK